MGKIGIIPSHLKNNIPMTYLFPTPKYFVRVMKGLKVITLFLLSTLARSDPFQNLNFESARTNSLMQSPDVSFDHYGPAPDLAAGWQIFHGQQLVGTVGFNLSGWGSLSPSISVVSSKPPYPFGEPLNPVEGKYSLSFEVWTSEQYTLAQRGDIPSDARFLAFTIRQLPFAVSVNGLNLSPPIQNGGDPPAGRTVLVDIAQFAGQNVELKFTTSSGPFGSYGQHEIDSIQFLLRDHLAVTHRTRPDGLQQVVITFAPNEGKNFFVEFLDDLGKNSSWQPLAGGPHNSGSVTSAAATAQRFYRLRITDQ